MTQTIDLTPTPDGYRATLRFIIANSTSETDRQWARGELARVEGVTEWAKPSAS